LGLLQRIVLTLVPNTRDSLLRVCISLVSMIRLYLGGQIIKLCAPQSVSNILKCHLECEHGVASNNVRLGRKVATLTKRYY
jgi:hypothetical protein